MKKLKNIALLALAIGTAACKDSFLAEKPFSSYTPATLNDSLGVEASLVGLYNHTSTIFTWSDRQGWVSVWQVGTDVANATANQEGIEIPYYNYNLLTPTDGAAARTWDRNYILINLSNIIINSLDSPNLKNITSVGKNKMSAEAKFFRAYAYNNLATCFGGVPLLTQALTAPKTDFTRASIDEVNNQIVADLTFAATNLPDIEDVKSNTKGKLYGRANKFMAMQLLGEVYLRMGKPELAETQLKAILSQVLYRFKQRDEYAFNDCFGQYGMDIIAGAKPVFRVETTKGILENDAAYMEVANNLSLTGAFIASSYRRSMVRAQVELIYQDTIRCFGENNGAILLKVTGGIKSYIYSKDSTNYFSDSLFTRLKVRLYNFWVKDANKCLATSQLSATEPALLDLSLLSKSNPLCLGESNGIVQLKATGGNGGNIYWQDNATKQSNDRFIGLTQGQYTYKVVDRKGCQDTVRLVELKWPAAILAQVSKSIPICYGTNTAKLNVQASGGVGAFTAILSNTN